MVMHVPWIRRRRSTGKCNGTTRSDWQGRLKYLPIRRTAALPWPFVEYGSKFICVQLMELVRRRSACLLLSLTVTIDSCGDPVEVPSI